MRMIPAILLLFALAVPAATLAQDMPAAPADELTAVNAEAVAFGPIEVPGFDPGLQIAVIHGDPNAESGDYTIRLKLPEDYRFPAHYHPKNEHLTVLSGTFLLAMGTSGDEEALQSYSPGAFLYIPAEHPHYGGVEDETVVQLHGEAPFQILLAQTTE